MTASLCFGTIGTYMDHVTTPAATPESVTTLSLYGVAPLSSELPVQAESAKRAVANGAS